MNRAEYPDSIINVMITLPAPSLTAIAILPIEKDLRRLPNNFILRLIVAMAAEYQRHKFIQMSRHSM